jgi:hypothetical protein
MSEINNARDDWRNANARQNFEPRTLCITNENKSISLAIVWVLGITVFISMAGIIGFSLLEHDVPQALIVFGSVAMGGLGSLFTHSK